MATNPMMEDVASQLKQKSFEGKIAHSCGQPFVKTYKYYCEILTSLRLADLETKLVKVQITRFQKFMDSLEGFANLGDKLNLNEGEFPPKTLQKLNAVCDLVEVEDLFKLSDGEYFDQDLFHAYLLLLQGMNQVAVKASKAENNMAEWVTMSQGVKKVTVLDPPVWTGEGFRSMETDDYEDCSNCDVLIPVVLKAEKLACLIHLSA